MHISFDLKKSVFVKGIFLLLVGLVAINIVLGQSFYVNWNNPYYGTSSPPPGSFTISSDQPSHSLSFISQTSSNPTASVDSNGNGIIDLAENARWAGASSFANDSKSVSGFIPTSNVISKGCVVADTGINGDSWATSTFLDLRISNTVLSQVGGNPATISENICEDGDGCSYNIVRYSKGTGTIKNVYSASNIYYFQLPRTQIGGGLAGAAWMDGAGTGATNTGTNGDTVKRTFVNWNSGGANSVSWFDISDDDPTIETIPDQWTIKDYDNSNSFIVTVCD